MSASERHDPQKSASDTTFGIFFALVFLIVAAYPVLSGGPVALWALGASAFLLVITLLRPGLLAPLNRLWFRIGMLLGAVVTPVVMALIYVTAFLPTGLIMRLRGRDLLRLKLDREAESYWIRRDRAAEPGSSMKNQF